VVGAARAYRHEEFCGPTKAAGRTVGYIRQRPGRGGGGTMGSFRGPVRHQRYPAKTDAPRKLRSRYVGRSATIANGNWCCRSMSPTRTVPCPARHGSKRQLAGRPPHRGEGHSVFALAKRGRPRRHGDARHRRRAMCFFHAMPRRDSVHHPDKKEHVDVADADAGAKVLPAAVENFPVHASPQPRDLERADFLRSSSRSIFLFEHGSFRKNVTTFPDNA